MATATGTYIAVDELRATLSSTTANYVSELRATGDSTTANLVRRMWLNDSSNILTMVWDVWNTVLTATIEDMPSEGGNVKDYLSVSSYGTDVEGDPHDLGYSFSPEYIDPTTSGSTTSKAVTVTQEGSGESVQLTAYIAGRVAVDTTYRTPTVTSTSISSVPASGNVTRYLTVNWSQVKVITYDNGTTSTSTVTGSSTATITSGSANNGSGAYISGGGVYVPSAGTTYYTSQRTAYTISKFTFTANEVSSGTVSRTVYVYQSANDRKSTTEYNVSCGAASVSQIANTGGTFTFTATCQSRLNYTYDSGSTGYSSWSDESATVGYSNGVSSVSPTSFTGSSTITVTVGVNTGTSRTPTVRVTAPDGTSDVITVDQASVSYVLTAMQSSSMAMAYSSKSFEAAFVCSTNGTAVKPTVSVSGDYIQGYTVTQSTSSPYPWVVKVTLTETNTSTQTRQYTVKVTHPNDSSLSETFTVTHNTMSANKPSFMNAVYAESNGWYLGQMKIATAVINSTSVNIYAIVAAKKNAITSSSTLTWQFTTNYLVGNPNGSGLVAYDTPQEYKSTQTIAAGTSNTISGTTVYGIQIVGGSPERFIDNTKTLVFTAT